MAPGLVAVGAPTLRAIRATTPTPPAPRLAIAHRSRTTVMAGEPEIPHRPEREPRHASHARRGHRLHRQGHRPGPGGGPVRHRGGTELGEQGHRARRRPAPVSYTHLTLPTIL